MTPIRTLIVDDEPLARDGMSDYLSRVDFLTETGRAGNGLEALEIIEAGNVELLLLDIQMPGLSGTELVAALRRPPAVIFTTAHPDFAVEGFALSAVDYLLKPIAFPRFLQGVMKARRLLRPVDGAPGTSTQEEKTTTIPNADLFVKINDRVERIQPADILYVEAMQNYSRIHTTTGSHLPLLPLSQLQEALPEDRFLLIHRSYLVNLDRLDGLVGNQVRIGKTLLPIARGRRQEVRNRLPGNIIS